MMNIICVIEQLKVHYVVFSVLLIHQGEQALLKLGHRQFFNL